MGRRWAGLDAAQRRNVVAGAAFATVLGTVVAVGVAGWDEPGQRLVAGSPPTTRPTTTRAGAAPTVPPTPSAARSQPADGGTATSTAPGGGDGASSGPGSTPAGGTGAGAGGGSGGSGSGAGAGGASGPGPSAGAGGAGDLGGRNSGVFGGVDPGAGGSGGSGRGSRADTGGTAVDTTTTTTTPAPSSPDAATVTVTREDNGERLTMAAGDILVVRLDEVSGATWSEPESDDPALARTSTDRSGGTVTVRFSAVQAGTAEVTASAPPLGSFLVTVQVTG